MGADPTRLDAAGVSVRLDAGVLAGALRYFDAGGAFVDGAAAVLGGKLPAPLSALRRDFSGGSNGMLVWRSPTETWVVGGDSGCHAALEHHAAGRADGCFVAQTGGISMVSLTGADTGPLLARLGSSAAIPQPGQALTARFAELCVTAVCLQRGETTLLVERVYAVHLWAWLRETLADWPADASAGR